MTRGEPLCRVARPRITPHDTTEEALPKISGFEKRDLSRPATFFATVSFGAPRKGFDLGHLLNKSSRLTPTGANQTTSTKGCGGTTCSQITISKILSLGHCRPQLGQRSGSRGTGGLVSSLMTTGCCHHCRQMEHGDVLMAFSSFFRRW